MIDVKGYRILTDEQKELMNELKISEERTMRVFDKITQLAIIHDNQSFVDMAMLTLGKRSMQVGYMWAVRSIAQPTRIALPEDAPYESVKGSDGNQSNVAGGNESSNKSD